MARIYITEADLTEAAANIVDSEIVYVPGYATTVTATTSPLYQQPTLCRTIADFFEKFGSTAPTYTAGYTLTSTNWDEDAFDSAKATMFASGEMERGYVYAAELINAGIPVVYEVVDIASNCNAENMYKHLAGDATSGSEIESVFAEDSKISDTGEYSIKYITSGGYPTFEYKSNGCAILMTALAENRGDCIALLDHTDYPGRALTGTGAVITNLAEVASLKSKFAAMFTPWADYALLRVATSETPTLSLPASFGYLLAVASAVTNNNSCKAIAGITRGMVPHLVKVNTDRPLTNGIADAYQPRTADAGTVAINAITNIKPYGYCIWGNRTTYTVGSGLVASNYLNIRNMCSDIKKQVRIACVSLMFEQNTDILWVDFLSLITPLLDKLSSSYGIKFYKITKEKEINGVPVAKDEIAATIKITPYYAVESFQIAIHITDDDVTVNG